MIWIVKPFQTLLMSALIAVSNTSVPTQITDRLGLAYFYKTLYHRVIADCTKSLGLDDKLADATFIDYAPPEAREQIEPARSKVGRR